MMKASCLMMEDDLRRGMVPLADMLNADAEKNNVTIDDSRLNCHSLTPAQARLFYGKTPLL
jgi:hypothetical protein